MDPRVVKHFRTTTSADTYERPRLRTQHWGVQKSFPGDGTNAASWRLRAAEQDRYSRLAQRAGVDPEKLVERATVAKAKEHLLGPAAALLRRAVEERGDGLSQPESVYLDLFDVYDKQGRPEQALKVKGTALYFTVVGHRAYALHEADSKRADYYYDLAAKAYDKAQDPARLEAGRPATQAVQKSRVPGKAPAETL